MLSGSSSCQIRYRLALRLRCCLVSRPFPGRDPDRVEELARLPHGRHGLPREFVEQNHRERLIAAFAGLVGEIGYWSVTINAIAEAANVSSRIFYQHFDSVEDCYVAAFERAVEWIEGPITEAWQAAEDWSGALAAALDAGLEEFAAFPNGARLMTAEPFVAGPKIAAMHRELVERLVPHLAQGRELSKEGDQLPASTEQSLLGSLNSVIGRKLYGGEAEALQKLRPDLLQFLATPYLGAAKARRLATA